MYIDDRPTDDRPLISKNSNGHISATDHPINFMFGSRVGFSGTADRMALYPVRTNRRWQPPPSWKNFRWPYLRNRSSDPLPRGGRTSSWKISNEYRPISGMLHLFHFHDSILAGIWERIMREE